MITPVNVPAEGQDPLVSHPVHYNLDASGVEAIEVKRCMTSDPGDAFKYVFRADLKNGRQDVDKARWYLTDALDHLVPVWIPGWATPGRAKLKLIYNAETDPLRQEFYDALIGCNVVLALRAVEGMLA